MIKKALIIEVAGRVQGVFFRASTKDFCDQIGLNGWVKNLPTGNVLIHAEGSDEQLNQLKAWCQNGPPTSRVDKVIVEETPPITLEGFEIRR